MSHSISRYHDFSAGHRVVGHESKCRFIHGHNYRVIVHARASTLDSVGRVVDFSVLKNVGAWLEEHWDHKLLLWNQDPLWVYGIAESARVDPRVNRDIQESLVAVLFNPTAENMAEYLCRTVCPNVLAGHGVTVHMVTVEETRKCSATYSL